MSLFILGVFSKSLYDDTLKTTNSKQEDSQIISSVEVYNQARTSSVEIIPSMSAGQSGSGFIYDITDTYIDILTNYHVVNNSGFSVVFSTGQSVSAEIEQYLALEDIASIRISKTDLSGDTLSEITAMNISDEIVIGDTSYVIGNALGMGISITNGIISFIHDGYNFNDISVDFIQTTAAINNGSSGGALINSNGDAVGLITAKVSSTSVEGVGFALPLYQYLPLLKSQPTSTDVEKTLLTGVSFSDTTEKHASLDSAFGAVVDSLNLSHQFSALGVKQGDVIVSVNNIEVEDSTTITTVLKSQTSIKSVVVVRCDFANSTKEEILLSKQQ